MEEFDKKQLIRLLEEIADLLEFKGENRFKVAAFRNGANTLRRYQDDLSDAIQSKKLGNIKGIGKGLQEVIYEFAVTGTAAAHSEALEGVPEGILDIMNIRGLGPKKTALLYNQLKISNIGELEKACKQNKIQQIKGFSAKSEQKILYEIQTGNEYKKYVLLSRALDAAEETLNTLSSFKSVKKASVTGELRRIREIVSELEFVVFTSSKSLFFKEIRENLYPEISEKDNKITVDNDRIPIIFHVTESEGKFCKQIFLTTGSAQFLKKLDAANESIPEKNEKEIFNNLKFGYLAPEMREEQFFQIEKTKLKKNTTLHEKDFQGFLHFHTVYSDGLNSLKEMIAAAENFGYSYFAVCDHSKTASYANGLDENRIELQKKEIEQTAKEMGKAIFQGIESDILNDGSLDYAPDVLKTFDLIVASVHSNFSMSKETMTQRIIKAVENPYTDILGHPTGRLLLSRAPYEVDMHKVIDACARNKVAIELNANPHRLDIDWRLLYYAREKECLISINQDAHAPAEIENIKYGIAIARKAGVQRTEIINCFHIDQFTNFLNRKVNRKFK